MSDWVTQSVTLLGPGMKPIRLVRLPGTHIMGMAVAGDFLYLCDAWKKVIQKRRLDDKLTLVGTYPSPGPSPSGLYHDGTYLWSADSGLSMIYQHNPVNMNVLANFAAPGTAPVALFRKRNELYSADAETRKVYLHRLDQALSIEEVLSLPALAEGEEPLATFTWKDHHFWLARDGRDILYKRAESSFTSEKK